MYFLGEQLLKLDGIPVLHPQRIDTHLGCKFVEERSSVLDILPIFLGGSFRPVSYFGGTIISLHT